MQAIGTAALVSVGGGIIGAIGGPGAAAIYTLTGLKAQFVDGQSDVRLAVIVPPLGRGSTGRAAKNLKEQLAVEQAQSNPAAGAPVPLTMGDPRWPASEGWVKMRQNINREEVHYVRNTRTRQVDDFKVVGR
jgi:hypothetical protein